MSISVQIVCDNCGKVISCGSGMDRKPAHIIRTKLSHAGWLIGGGPEEDLCDVCRPPSVRARKIQPPVNSETEEHESARYLTLRLRPWTVKKSDALSFVKGTHRRLPDIQGAMWCVTVRAGHGRDGIVACALVGHPSQEQTTDEYELLRVTRVAAKEGYPNACSMLYAACWRAARAMGATSMDTFTHLDEPGTSLRAAGWIPGGVTAGGEYSRKSRPRKPQKDAGPKQRWWAPGSKALEINP